jgi:thioredoxin-like negative regulator of GroEL
MNAAIRFSVLLFLAALASASGELPAGWGTNYNFSLAEARGRQKPLLMYFTASWCGPCKLMARTTLTNKVVVDALASICCVAVDIDEQPDLAAKREIRAVPTFKLLSAKGDEVATSTGYQEPAQFLEWLTNGVREVGAVVDAQARAERDLAAADEMLHQADTATKRKAVSTLLGLCAGRDSTGREAAAKRLADVAKSQPELLLDGMMHPRLVVRIQAANLLGASLGDKFDIDPWTEQGRRQKDVARLREQLGGKK